MRVLLCVAAILMLAGCAGGPPPESTRAPQGRVYPFEDPALDAVTETRLTRFESEGAFRAYIQRVGRLREQRRGKWAAARGPRFAMQDQPPPCPPDDPDCLEEAQDGGSDIVVTGSSVAPPSITNVQTLGVDEGDIVKQIGDYLLVLQDGRIFSVDTRGGPRLVDRIDVYRDPQSDAWYDEMLVQGDRILVAAYSYDEQATELSIFTLDTATGKVRADGVFLISSDDYYSVDNYATRIVGDRLILYTPYDIDGLEDAADRPVIRRWLPPAERARAKLRGTPLLDARDIHRPVQRTAQPTVHSLTVCPLGAWRPGRDLSCDTTAFVAPGGAEMFVSPTEIFLWTWPDYDDVGWRDWSEEPECAGERRAERRNVLPAAIFRLDVRSGEASVAGALGTPFDQFSMDSRDGAFRALVDWNDFRCGFRFDRPREVSFVSIPEAVFGEDFLPIAERRVTPLPAPGTIQVENRFADDWLVYGGRDGRRRHPPERDDGAQASRVVAVPVRSPDRPVILNLPHNVIRLERVGGDGVVLNGYRDDSGLDVSLLKLGQAPAIVSRAHLAGRYESEGRSHAFNSVVGTDGSGLMGVPTVRRPDDAEGWWWRTESSGLSFVRLAPGGALADAGELALRGRETHPDYACEVSCIDWYGNSRPIFTGGRIFGLMGTELVEATLKDGKVVERRWIDLTAPPGSAGSSAPAQ